MGHVWVPVEKAVPVVSIEAHEMQEQVQVTMRQEQPVEVPVAEAHELKVHVANIQNAPRDVVRHPKTTHVVVKEEVVPVELMRQKAQYVPQVQTIELIKEEPSVTVKQVQKSIPKYEMKYINNVITVGPKYMEHVQDIEEEYVESGTMRAVEEFDTQNVEFISATGQHTYGTLDDDPHAKFKGEKIPGYMPTQTTVAGGAAVASEPIATEPIAGGGRIIGGGVRSIGGGRVVSHQSPPICHI